MLGFGWDGLCEWPGIDWDTSRLLKLPLTWILISNFFVIFFTFCSASSNSFQPLFRVLLLAYVMCTALG